MKATRPGEFICFCPVTIPTTEGEGHIFLFIDAYSGFAINTGVEPSGDAEAVIKHIYLLTEHPDFIKNIKMGYTLVLNDYYDLAQRIKSVIQPHGKMLFDEDFHEKICKPAVESMFSKLREE